MPGILIYLCLHRLSLRLAGYLLWQPIEMMDMGIEFRSSTATEIIRFTHILIRFAYIRVKRLYVDKLLDIQGLLVTQMDHIYTFLSLTRKIIVYPPYSRILECPLKENIVPLKTGLSVELYRACQILPGHHKGFTARVQKLYVFSAISVLLFAPTRTRTASQVQRLCFVFRPILR